MYFWIVNLITAYFEVNKPLPLKTNLRGGNVVFEVKGPHFHYGSTFIEFKKFV